jgi:hypothetical protein
MFLWAKKTHRGLGCARIARRPYALLVIIRSLLAALVALTLSFAPSVAMAAQGAAPLSMTDYQMPEMKSGHCQSVPATSDDHGKAPVENCCASMCMAVAIPPLPPVADRIAPRLEAAIAFVPSLHLGITGEIATPPPRLA